MRLYQTIGGAAGCRKLATAFYTRVGQNPILRPFFPSTFTCAIEEFSAFLVQFLGGEPEATQRRWWLSLRESHDRFSLGPRERDAWVEAMTLTLRDDSLIADDGARHELLAFFQHTSAYVVNKGKKPAVDPLDGELASLWDEQVTLDRAVQLARSPETAAECIGLLQSAALQARFARSPSVHASVVALAATSKSPMLREYAISQLRAQPSLVNAQYQHGRTLLHDAAAAGDRELVELLLDLGAGRTIARSEAPPPLYCVGNQCSKPGAGEIIRILLRRTADNIDAAYGVKRCTALHMAARRGNVEVIEALLDAGASVEVRDSMGDTPLRRAVNCDKVDAARLFLTRGADPASPGSKGLTPKFAARSPRMKQLFAATSARS